MKNPKTVQLRVTKRELKLLIAAFGEVNVAVKHVESMVLPLLDKFEKALVKFPAEKQEEE